MDISNLFLIASVLIFLLYKIWTRKYNYWKNKGIKQLNSLPFFGDHIKALIRKLDAIENALQVYKPFKKYGIGGVYIFGQSFLAVTDRELLKKIMVKDAEYFLNRHDWSSSTDPLMTKNLSILKDDEWRKMRALMTTVFTSSKMKDMFVFMEKCAGQSVEYIESKLSESDVTEVDLKDFFSRYGTDVIASTAFGLEVDSFKYPKNEFFCSGEYIRKHFSGFSLKLFLIFFFPKIAKYFNVSFFGQKCTQFFINVVSETIRERELKNIVRKDVIQILMEARKRKEMTENEETQNVKFPELTDLDITAQAIIFFLAGFETVATLLGFISYELAINLDIQEKLQEEIDLVIEKENGVTYYGIMHKMEYLNMVVNETLRKWPIAVMTDRVVSRTYILPKTEKTPEIVLNKGDKVVIPIAGFHRDPEYFPDPDKFDPERFRDEKNTIESFSYLPFGEGLRHCVGMRYALMEAKTIIVQLLRKFTIVPTKTTVIPIKLSKGTPFMLIPEGGFVLGLKARNHFYV